MVLVLVSLLRNLFLFLDFIVKNHCPTFLGSVTSCQVLKCSLHKVPLCGSLQMHSGPIENLPTQTQGSMV